MPIDNSLHKKYEAALRDYYGAERDALAYPPAVQNVGIAHELAVRLNEDLANINESDIARTAMRGLSTLLPRDRSPKISIG